MKSLILFIFFFPFFVSFFVTHNSKAMMVCANTCIIHIKWLLCYRVSSFSKLERHMNYNWWTATTKWSPSMQDVLVWQFQWLLFTYSGCGTYSQAYPNYWMHVLQAGTSWLVTNYVSWSSSIVLSILLGLLEGCFVKQRKLLCTYACHLWMPAVW